MEASEARIVDPGDAVDLHMHTLASDGRWTPEALIDHLAENEFKIIAIADHDSMDSVPEALERGAARGITVIPAVEMTTRWEERQVHCLIYGVDIHVPESRRFMDLLRRQQDDLAAMSERIMRLVESNGRRVRSLDEVLDGRPPKPYMVYRAMIRDGHGHDLRTAHNIVKGMGEPGLVDVPLDETVAAAHEAGALAVIAHPGRDDGWGVLKHDGLDRILTGIPIDGIEAHYRSYKDEDVGYYRTWAEEHGKVVSAGSDSHWQKFPVDPIPYPARWVGGLLAALGFEVGGYEGPAWVPPEPAAASSG